MTAIGVQPAQRNDRLVAWMIVAVTTAALAVPLTSILVIGLDSLFGVDPWFERFIGSLGLWASITATVFAGGLIGVLLIRPPRARTSTRIGATLGSLAGATPASVVLFFRFQFPGCVGLNFFGVPWPEPWQTIAQVVTAGVALGVVVLIVTCLFMSATRWSALAALGWLLVAAIPTFLVFFLSVSGDPAPGCIRP